MDNHSSEEHQQQHITIEEPAHPLSTPERHQNRPRRSPSRESRLSFQSESDREFVRRVSFDKVPVDGSATHQGRTCSIHFVTKKYERSRRPRTFMVLVNADADETWAIEYTLQVWIRLSLLLIGLFLTFEVYVLESGLQRRWSGGSWRQPSR